MFKNFIFSLILIIFSFSANAAELDGADIYAEKLVKDSFTILNDKSKSMEEKIEASEDLIRKNMDLEWMSKFVLGKFRRSLNKEQMADFSEIYSQYVVKTYSSALKGYSNQKLNISTVNRIGEREFVCKTFLVQPKKEPIRVDYVIREIQDGNFKVFDIVTEGISLINSHQSEFINIMTNLGFESLIDELRKKTSQLSK